MISSNNRPLNQEPIDSDFTIEHYQELLILAKKQYIFAGYKNIPWGEKFVLWRHDCDYSLNRAYALASIEADEGIRATYFLNPHCEFYNLLEKKQHRLVLDILKMGHDIGLHFDAAFHDTSNETQLSDQITTEAALLESLYGVKPLAFSFHNPIAANLSCENEVYGGLVNCYSQRFKAEVPYCSDSNGYWRFRRLKDVLSEAKDPCLQVLTHPGWWQKTAMPPRTRIFRSAYGRAAATLRDYDSGLELHDRLNHAGPARALIFLKKSNPQLFELCDYLWNTGNLQTLFLELWHLHKVQINRLCKAELYLQWNVPSVEIDNFFENTNLRIDGSKLFKCVFGKDWSFVTNINQSSYRHFLKLQKLLINSCVSITQQQLEDGCKFLCNIIEELASWGEKQIVNFDGISDIESIDIHPKSMDEGPVISPVESVDNIEKYSKQKWGKVKLKSQIIDSNGAA